MKRLTVLLSFIALSATITSFGAQVPVNDLWGNNGAGGEWNLYNSGVGPGVGNGIMEYLYGAGNFTRLDDTSLKAWSAAGTSHTVGVAGVYAGASENLYTTALDGSSPNHIISPGGTIGSAPSRFFSTASFTPAADPFLFLDHVPGYSDAYSDPSLNAGGLDRMVAFSISGYLTTAGNSSTFTPFSDGLNHYVLGFEDGGDGDYQDLVIEVAGVNAPDGGTTLALLGFAMVGVESIRRKLSK